jgi:hypothetical protein
LQHVGSDSSLDRLPSSPFHEDSEAATRQVVDLDDLPQIGLGVRLAAAGRITAFSERAERVIFGPLGETRSSGETVVWLASGQGKAARFLPVTVHPVTGLAEIGEFTDEGPPRWLSDDATITVEASVPIAPASP